MGIEKVTVTFRCDGEPCHGGHGMAGATASEDQTADGMRLPCLPDGWVLACDQNLFCPACVQSWSKK